MYMRELRVSYRRRRRAIPMSEGERLNSAEDAARILTRLIGHEAVEVAVVLCLSVRHEILAFHELSRGTLDTTPVHPRELFKVALLANAASIIIGHNHPSGDAAPSREDLLLTLKLRAASQLMGVELLDHVIVTPTTYLSLKDTGNW